MGGRTALARRSQQGQRHLQPRRVRRAAAADDAGLGRPARSLRAEPGRSSEHAAHHPPGGRARPLGRGSRECATQSSGRVGAAPDRDQAGRRDAAGVGRDASAARSAVAAFRHGGTAVRHSAPADGTGRCLRGAAQPASRRVRQDGGQVAPMDQLRDQGRQPAGAEPGQPWPARAGLASRSGQARADPGGPQADQGADPWQIYNALLQPRAMLRGRSALKASAPRISTRSSWR